MRVFSFSMLFVLGTAQLGARLPQIPEPGAYELQLKELGRIEAEIDSYGTTAQLADLERLEENLLATMAHEIGHVVIGAGHPDAYEDPDDSDVQGGLRYSTEVSGNPNKLLVKGEWDKAELWLEARENP